jgi:hypothetical protein
MCGNTFLTAEHIIVLYTSGFNDNERKELQANDGLASRAVLLPLIIEHKKRGLPQSS